MSKTRTKIHVLKTHDDGGGYNAKIVINIHWRTRIFPFSGPRSALQRIAKDPRIDRLHNPSNTTLYRARIVRTQHGNIVRRYYDFRFRVLPNGQLELEK